MGLPHLIVALGAPGWAAPEESGSEPAAESGDFEDKPACEATKEKRVSAVVFGGREGGVKGLVEAPVQEVLARISAEW